MSAPYSRLGCQVKVADEDLTVELTQESIQTWHNEHPGKA
jgi:2Fe-2S ferredoxin